MAILGYDELIERLSQGERKEVPTATADPHIDASGDCGADCYEIEAGGQRIRRTWTGQCRQKFQTPMLRQLQRDCWHCGGHQLCTCIVCADKLAPSGSGECAVCYGSGKVMTWLQ